MIVSKIFPIVSKFDNKKFLILMIIVIIIVMIDSEIGIVADFIPKQLSSIWGIGAFVGIAIIFVVSHSCLYLSLYQVPFLHRMVLHSAWQDLQYISLFESELYSNTPSIIQINENLFRLLKR